LQRRLDQAMKINLKTISNTITDTQLTEVNLKRMNKEEKSQNKQFSFYFNFQWFNRDK